MGVIKRERLVKSYSDAVFRSPGRLRFVAVALVLVVLLAGTACGSTTETAGSDEEPAVAVEVRPVEKGDVLRIIRASNELEATRDVYLAPAMGGTVEEVRVQAGDQVAEGDVLVALVKTDVALQVEQASAALAAARAAFEQAEEGAKPEQLKQLQAGVDQALANRDQAIRDYQRMDALYREGAISEQMLEKTKLGMTVAEKQYEQALSQLKLAEDGASEAQLDAVRAQVQQAQAAYDLARRRLDDMTLTAPFDGVVSMINATAGQKLAPGNPVARVVGLNQLRLAVGVDATVVNRLAPGDKATIVVTALGRELGATVATVSPASDPQTKQYTVQLDVPNSEGDLKPGMLAEAHLVQEGARDVTVVPYSAVVQRDEGPVVYVVDGDIVHEQQVTTGIDNGTSIAILQGLEVGDQLVVSGQEFVSDGSRVRVTEQQSGGSGK